MSENKSWNSSLLSDIQLLISKPNKFSEYKKQTKCSAILNIFRMAYMLCTDIWLGQGASHMSN